MDSKQLTAIIAIAIPLIMLAAAVVQLATAIVKYAAEKKTEPPAAATPKTARIISKRGPLRSILKKDKGSLFFILFMAFTLYYYSGDARISLRAYIALTVFIVPMVYLVVFIMAFNAARDASDEAARERADTDEQENKGT